jgi:hypothetical protein
MYQKAKTNFESFNRNSIVKLSDIILEFKDETICYSILFTMAYNFFLH